VWAVESAGSAREGERTNDSSSLIARWGLGVRREYRRAAQASGEDGERREAEG